MELPEMVVLSRQMNCEISSKRIVGAEVSNPKCLNMSLGQFCKTIIGRTIISVTCRGKWLFIELDRGYTLLFNPGMGADVIRFEPGQAFPDKYHIKFMFDDSTGFTVRVWWFCYLHLVSAEGLKKHNRTAALGPTPLDKSFTIGYFKRLLQERKGSIKSLLLDQKRISGIGNVYAQDILYGARIHPNRSIDSLSDAEIRCLYDSIRTVLKTSIRFGGLAYEKDFHGNKGRYGKEHFKVAYKAGESCPKCRATILKIKTGATSSYICPECQTIRT